MIKLCEYCSGPFEFKVKRGTPRKYCSVKCRKMAADDNYCDVPGCRIGARKHIHCPECGSTKHVAESCNMLG